MADVATIPPLMLNRPVRLSPIERQAGRLLRAPDGHEGGGDAAPAADAAPAPAAEAPAEPTDALKEATILGGGDQPADDAAKPGDEAKAGDEPKPDDAPKGAPEKYEIALPDGVVLDETSWAVAEPVIRELGLDNDQANKLAAMAPALFEARDKAVAEASAKQTIDEVVALRRDWATACQNDPTYGGANFEASKVNAARFIDNYGGAALRKVLDETGVGNNPAMFAALAKAGAELAEDVPPRGGATEGKPKTIGEVFYPASG